MSNTASHIYRWSAGGAGLGLLAFLADLVSAAVAIGSLFVPSTGAFGLLLAAAVTAMVLGGAVGFLVAWLPWHRFAPLRRATRHGRWLAPVVLLLIAIGGYLERARGRQLTAQVSVADNQGIPILMIVVDTLRADALYGADRSFPEAPNLRRWVQKATVFADAESAAGWTIPATACLITGIHPTTMDASAGWVPRWAPTLAEHLRARGYATHAVVDNMTLERRNGFARGFDSFTQRSSFRFAFSLWAFRLLPEPVQLLLRERSRTFYHGARGTTETAMAHLRAQETRPLFLYVHYMDPHAPYHAHPATPDPEGVEAINFYRYRDRLVERQGPLPTAAQLRLLRHRYGGEIRHFDEQVGRLLAAWHKKFGRQGVVLFTSDHGEEFLDHGRLGHGVTLHREMVWVPLILELPQKPGVQEAGGRWLEEPVGHIDITPTLLDLAGVQAITAKGLAPIQGRSLTTWLSGGAPHQPSALLASHSRNGRRVHRLRQGSRACVRTMYYDGRATEYQLFDLRSDPMEQTDLLAAAKEKDPLTGELDTLAHRLWRSFEPLSDDESEANLETLRAMGYIQ